MKNGNALPKHAGCKKELLITVADIDGLSILPCETRNNKTKPVVFKWL